MALLQFNGISNVYKADQMAGKSVTADMIMGKTCLDNASLAFVTYRDRLALKAS